MPQQLIIFVCTGNICRSPMAEYLLRERLGPKTPWQVQSAGVVAPLGVAASHAAVVVLDELGIDLTPHTSQPLTTELVDAASVVVVMSASHLQQVRVIYANVYEKTFLLKSSKGWVRTGISM